MKRLVFLAIVVLSAKIQHLQASIFCPPNKTVYCYEDIHNLNVMGWATALGYPSNVVKYADNTSQTNNCGVGTISRKWYVDGNQNNMHDQNESSCIQLITVLANSSPIDITWPQDKTYTCIEDIAYERPVANGGPCDVLGISLDTMVFTAGSDACYKLMRRWKVINWCTYHPTDPNWHGEGYYQHVQWIHVVEKTPPTIADCDNKIIGLTHNCVTPLTLMNSATDYSLCQSGNLKWTVEIDLWANGSKDYVYGYLEKGDYYLPPVANGDTVSLTLPIHIGAGKHKVYWSVSDACGNIKTCQQQVETKDLKPPTPYMHPLLSASFDATVMDLMVSPKLFDLGSYDNCSSKVKLKFSFSPNVEDTLRIIDCSNAGFQFFTIYVTDESGNQDFVEVFLLAFDNGSCFTSNISGLVTSSDGFALSDVSVALSRPNQPTIMSRSDIDGVFSWNNISIFQDYSFETYGDIPMHKERNIGDLKLLQDYLLGRAKLVNYQWVAADVNGDLKITSADLYLLKSMILKPEKYRNNTNNWITFSKVDTIKSITDLSSLKSKIGIQELKDYPKFTAVYRGDITDANESITQDQIDLKILQVSKASANIELENKGISGVMLRLASEAQPENISITAQGREIHGEWSAKDQNGIYTWLSLPQQPIYDGIQISSTDEELKLDIVGAHLVDNQYRTYSSKNVIVIPDREQTIYPNPSPNGCFKISNVEVVRIQDPKGRIVTYDKTQDMICLPNSFPGIYQLIYRQDGQLKVVKLAVVK